jgi:hypothetical protein
VVVAHTVAYQQPLVVLVVELVGVALLQVELLTKVLVAEALVVHIVATAAVVAELAAVVVLGLTLVLEQAELEFPVQ